MAEILVEYTDVVTTTRGNRYLPRACGAAGENGMWLGWIEFVDLDSGEVLCSPRETTQPNRADTLYWATGITAVYLEGALERALQPVARTPAAGAEGPAREEAARRVQTEPTAPEGILNPFSIYRKGTMLLRSQLRALSAWHLVNIIRAYDLSPLSSTTLNGMAAGDLVELIVAAVERQEADAIAR